MSCLDDNIQRDIHVRPKQVMEVILYVTFTNKLKLSDQPYINQLRSRDTECIQGRSQHCLPPARCPTKLYTAKNYHVSEHLYMKKEKQCIQPSIIMHRFPFDLVQSWS